MQYQRCTAIGQPLVLTATQTARQLVAEEGPLRLFRGVSTMLGASLPAHAVYFSVFEAAKKALNADTNTLTPMASGLAGVIATVCHDSIMTPMDVRCPHVGFPAGVDRFCSLLILMVLVCLYCNCL